jgi:uncharacterized protein (DUF1697 family)
MTRYSAFLRGINVSGQKLIKMERLKEIWMTIPDVSNVSTYIQSGNVAFDHPDSNDESLRILIESTLKRELGYEVPTLLRSRQELEAIIAANPFAAPFAEGERKLYVTMLSTPALADKLELLKPFAMAEEEYQLLGRELYLMLPSYGNTKLSNTLVEKKLGVQATTRNWATINKMVGM